MSNQKPAEVIIVGAGFAGIQAAKALSGANCRVTVLDKTNHHLFQPLLYQVATAGLSPADISAPIRGVLRHAKNTEVILAEVSSLDLEHSLVRLADGAELSYDYLVFAAGARHSYFGNDTWETLAPGLKTLEDAVEIRRRVLSAFEDAERTQDEEEKKRLLTFVVVGGGPTGVEVAGALSELARYALCRDFRHIRVDQTRILLMEAGPRILQALPCSLSEKAMTYLSNLGVEVCLGQLVTGLSERAVLLGEKIIPCGAVVWAAGVAPSNLASCFPVRDKIGRVEVLPDLSVPGFPRVFVCGDVAAVKQKNGSFVPGQAPGAIQMGRHAAYNIKRLLSGKPSKSFKYLDKGSLATIGRIYAVGEAAGLRFTGLLARLVWIFVHIFYLISFRNRLLVVTQWTWSFFTYRRGARLISDDFLRAVNRRATLANKSKS